MNGHFAVPGRFLREKFEGQLPDHGDWKPYARQISSDWHTPLINPITLATNSSSVALVIARRVESPITVCGFTLDRGAIVSLRLGAANRDPAVFTDPDRLDIGRKEGCILAFGFGPHFCVGSALVNLEASAFSHEIGTRYPKLQLAISPAEIEWRHTVSLRSPLTLPVVTR